MIVAVHRSQLPRNHCAFIFLGTVALCLIVLGDAGQCESCNADATGLAETGGSLLQITGLRSSDKLLGVSEEVESPVELTSGEAEELLHAGEDCWYACSERSGYCPHFCGHGNACCRLGMEADAPECLNADLASVYSHHECVRVDQAPEIQDAAHGADPPTLAPTLANNSKELSRSQGKHHTHSGIIEMYKKISSDEALKETPISEEDFQAVSQECCQHTFDMFSRRLLAQLEMKVCNEGCYNGWFPWFSCNKVENLTKYTEGILVNAEGECPCFAAIDEACPPGLAQKCLLGDPVYDESVHRRRVCGKTTTQTDLTGTTASTKASTTKTAALTTTTKSAAKTSSTTSATTSTTIRTTTSTSSTMITTTTTSTPTTTATTTTTLKRKTTTSTRKATTSKPTTTRRTTATTTTTTAMTTSTTSTRTTTTSTTTKLTTTTTTTLATTTTTSTPTTSSTSTPTTTTTSTPTTTSTSTPTTTSTTLPTTAITTTTKTRKTTTLSTTTTSEATTTKFATATLIIATTTAATTKATTTPKLQSAIGEPTTTSPPPATLTLTMPPPTTLPAVAPILKKFSTTTLTTTVQCTWPDNVGDYTLITELNAKIHAKSIDTGLAIGGTLNDGTPTEMGTVGGPVIARKKINDGLWDFKGGKTIASLSTVLDWSELKKLARQLQELDSDGYIIKVFTKGGAYSMDDARPNGNPNEDGKTLMVFNTNEAIMLEGTSDGRPFGPSVLAPFSTVTLNGNAGYAHGQIIAKKFAPSSAYKVGSSAGSLEMHGIAYKGPMQCEGSAAEPAEPAASTSTVPSTILSTTPAPETTTMPTTTTSTKKITTKAKATTTTTTTLAATTTATTSATPYKWGEPATTGCPSSSVPLDLDQCKVVAGHFQDQCTNIDAENGFVSACEDTDESKNRAYCSSRPLGCWRNKVGCYVYKGVGDDVASKQATPVCIEGTTTTLAGLPTSKTTTLPTTTEASTTLQTTTTADDSETPGDSTQICELPIEAANYSLIVEKGATVHAKLLYTGLAVGEKLQDGTPSASGVVKGDTMYTTLGGGKWEFQKSETQVKGSWIVKMAVNWKRLAWLAQNLKNLQESGYRVKVFTKGGKYSMDDIRDEGDPYEEGKSLMVFNTADDILLEGTQSGRQLGPSVLAPFARVTLQGNAGFSHGQIIAKFFGPGTTYSISNADGLQMHGEVYKGPLECK